MQEHIHETATLAALEHFPPERPDFPLAPCALLTAPPDFQPPPCAFPQFNEARCRQLRSPCRIVAAGGGLDNPHRISRSDMMIEFHSFPFLKKGIKWICS